jgi:hypothetical protein
VLRNTDRGFKLETTNSPVATWMRATVGGRMLGLASRLPPVRRVVFNMMSQFWINYRGSRAVGPGTGALKPGDRAPFAPVETTPEGASSVLDLTHGAGYHLLVFSPGDTDVDALASRLAARYTASVTAHVIPAAERAAYRAYHVDGPRLVLVRPDGHVAAVADPAFVDSLITYMDTVLNRARVPS